MLPMHIDRILGYPQSEGSPEVGRMRMYLSPDTFGEVVTIRR